MLLLAFTSGCGLYHFVFYPPEDCACTEQVLQPEYALDEQDRSAADHEDDTFLTNDTQDDHELDEDHHATDHGHNDEDSEEEGDEDEIVADIDPGDLKKLGVAETDEGSANARSQGPTTDSPAERQKQAARLERAHQIVDVIEPGSRVDLHSKEQRSAAGKYGVSLPTKPNAHVMTGDFFPGQDNLVIVTPGNSIKIYADGRLAAQRPLPSQDDALVLDEITENPVLPVRLVQNSVLQILIHSAETQPDGAILYKARIYKVFGNEIGLIFDETIARRDAADQPLQRVGRVDFLHGMNHRFIRWTSLKNTTNTDAEPSILRWNRWEGTYRIPAPPPTAPKNQS